MKRLKKGQGITWLVILLACMALANQWTRRHVYGGA